MIFEFVFFLKIKFYDSLGDSSVLAANSSGFAAFAHQFYINQLNSRYSNQSTKSDKRHCCLVRQKGEHLPMDDAKNRNVELERIQSNLGLDKFPF